MELAVDHRRPSSSSDAPRGAQDHALSSVLAELGERVRPVALARERSLPVPPAFRQIVPDGLTRGQVVSSSGAASRSVAFGLVREALIGGAWAAVVDVPTFGVDAAAEIGVPLERVVRIDSGIRSGNEEGGGVDLDRAGGTGRDVRADSRSALVAWADVVAAAVDGFDVVLVQVPEHTSAWRPASIRTLRSRIQNKGSVVVALGGAGLLGADIELVSERSVWGGLEHGFGRLRGHRVDVRASGRRAPLSRRCSIEFRGDGDRVSMSTIEADTSPVENTERGGHSVGDHGSRLGTHDSRNHRDVDDSRMVG